MSSTPAFFVYTSRAVSAAEFVSYWFRSFTPQQESRYTSNIEGPHSPESIRELFGWKIGERFEEAHQPIVQRFIDGFALAQRICQTASAEEFLTAFPSGGAIYRIFWSHCWQPVRFPIYDQHVHRAMTFLQTGKCEELSEKNDKEKIELYLRNYIPFSRNFEGLDYRQVDRALWSFGRFIKRPPITLPSTTVDPQRGVIGLAE